MKITNVAAIVAVAALAATGSAQRPGMGGPGGRMGGGMGMGMGRPRDPKEQAERQTQMMTQMLGLNAVQQAKVKAIVMKSAMDMKRIRDAQTAALKKVLTADQSKKLDSMRGPGGPGGPGGGMGRGMGRP